jgi:hypothetical protein
VEKVNDIETDQACIRPSFDGRRTVIAIRNRWSLQRTRHLFYDGAKYIYRECDPDGPKELASDRVYHCLKEVAISAMKGTMTSEAIAQFRMTICVRKMLESIERQDPKDWIAVLTDEEFPGRQSGEE